MNIVEDVKNCLLPEPAKKFLGTVQPRPLMQNIMYVGILSLLGLIGTVIGLAVVGFCPISGICFRWPITLAVIAGIIGLIGNIIGVVGAGMILSALSQGTLGRLVSNEETVTLASLAATPALLAGIFSIIPGLGWLFIFLAFIYAAVLFYLGAVVRFGQDKALVATILYIIFLIIISAIFTYVAGGLYSGVWYGRGISTSVPVIDIRGIY